MNSVSVSIITASSSFVVDTALLTPAGPSTSGSSGGGAMRTGSGSGISNGDEGMDISPWSMKGFLSPGLEWRLWTFCKLPSTERSFATAI
jgi:hypothetical protein